MNPRIILRIIVTPIIFALLLLTHLYHVIYRTINFVRFGGEFSEYASEDKTMIQDIYNELKKTAKK